MIDFPKRMNLFSIYSSNMEMFCFRLNPPGEPGGQIFLPTTTSADGLAQNRPGPKKTNKSARASSFLPGEAPTTATHWIGLGQNERRRGDGDKICHTSDCSWETARTAASTSHEEPRGFFTAAAAGPLMPDSPQLHQPPPPPAPPPASATPAAPAAANAQPKLTAVKLRMIIKGVLGRYQRWNPVHPTAGTFWGVGLGVGCGVGWGPGFGPEVIGYVGAGCGVGFSVGFTLAGVGIGLPQHSLIRNHDHGGFASSVPVDSARFYALTIIRGLVWDAISYVGNAAAMRKESRQKLPRFQDSPQVPGGVDLPKLGKGVSSSIRSTVECIRAFKDQRWPP